MGDSLSVKNARDTNYKRNFFSKLLYTGLWYADFCEICDLVPALLSDSPTSFYLVNADHFSVHTLYIIQCLYVIC